MFDCQAPGVLSSFVQSVNHAPILVLLSGVAPPQKQTFENAGICTIPVLEAPSSTMPAATQLRYTPPGRAHAV